jgi:hypothetical protein
LTIEMNERAPAGRIFAGGETRLNESMVEVMAVALTSNSPSGSITAEHLKWAAEALKHLGFNPSKLREDIDRLDLDVFERLKALALEAEPTVTPQGLKWLGSSKQMAEWERLGMLRFEGSLIEDFGYEKDAARKAALDAVERMKATWEERRDGLHLAARSPIDAAISILKDGRFKSQFEVRRSQGALSPHTRREAELRGLGITEDVTDDQRPIYGYVETLNARQEKVGVSQYGPIKWVLKDHVKDRTTITWGDSLYSMKQGDSGSIPYNGEFSAAAMASTEFPSVGGHLTSACYIEAQMQGQVWIEDVAEVRIVNPRLRLYGRRAVAFGLDDELEELERKSVWENGLTRGEKWTELKHLIRLLDEAGIPWSVEGEQEWEAQEW